MSEDTPDNSPIGHRERTYERPDFPYRCGREKLWSLACSRGPNADGSCGGVSECMPTRKGDLWHCSRSLAAGGPCKHGPKPDGSCYTRRPPCKPGPSLRAKRSHVTFLSFFISLGLVITFFSGPTGLLGAAYNLASPGPLTAAHANLTKGNQCGLCHVGHDLDGAKLIAAMTSYQDISKQCIACHAFNGHASHPHNKPAGENIAPQTISCLGCHSEHQGEAGTITKIEEKSCHLCHEDALVFDSFSGAGGDPHPTFTPDFGRLAERSIKFDHVRHFDRHFAKATVKQHRPENCSSCHRPDSRGLTMTSPDFETGCAACHEGQIKDQPLTLLTWPEMETVLSPTTTVRAVCGTSDMAETDEFDPVSYEIPGSVDAFLMAIDPDDMSQFSAPYQDLAQQMAIEGIEPLADLIVAKGGDPSKLLAGLSSEAASKLACAWLANEEYEGFEERDGQGWFAGPLSLAYKPLRHADPVVIAWLRLALRSDDENADALGISDLRTELFDTTTGPGSCAGCHSLGDTQSIQWTSAAPNSAHSYFSHAPHLALDEAAGRPSCSTCHELTEQTSGPATFAAIDTTNCQTCHGRDGVGETCNTCHLYHPRTQ